MLNDLRHASISRGFYRAHYHIIPEMKYYCGKALINEYERRLVRESPEDESPKELFLGLLQVRAIIISQDKTYAAIAV